MKAGIAFTGIKVDGDVIIDGHHRYVASLIADVYLDKYPSSKTSATKITDWEDVKLINDEWDTDAKILILNEQDAKYNNISLEKLNEILK